MIMESCKRSAAEAASLMTIQGVVAMAHPRDQPKGEDGWCPMRGCSIRDKSASWDGVNAFEGAASGRHQSMRLARLYMDQDGNAIEMTMILQRRVSDVLMGQQAQS